MLRDVALQVLNGVRTDDHIEQVVITIYRNQSTRCDYKLCLFANDIWESGTVHYEEITCTIMQNLF